MRVLEDKCHVLVEMTRSQGALFNNDLFNLMYRYEM